MDNLVSIVVSINFYKFSNNHFYGGGVYKESEMKDWIYYYIVIIAILNLVSLGISLTRHGEDKNEKVNFFIDFVGLLFLVPLIGRALGWF